MVNFDLFRTVCCFDSDKFLLILQVFSVLEASMPAPHLFVNQQLVFDKVDLVVWDLVLVELGNL